MKETKITFPNLLAELARQGMTALKLAELLGMNKATLYNKINGRAAFTLEDVFAIQRILKAGGGDYTIDYLFQRSGA